MGLSMGNEHLQYLESLEAKLQKLYKIAQKTREKGLDPALKPESEIARDLAGLVEGLVGPLGVAESIRELSEKLPREELAFKIAEEIVYGKFGHMETQTAAEQAIRTSLAILTEGITAAPLQGVAKVAIKSNLDQTKYLAIYFAGPIRSAGGTDQALTLVIGDFVRRLLGLDRYKPTEEETNRFIEEMRLYERDVGRFQYHIEDEQLRLAIESLPVEVTGTESNQVEVQTFRNLPRIETNCVRGGALRVVNDGVVGRAAKVFTIIEKLGVERWDWLKHVSDAKGSQEENRKTASFMEDIIAGRPIFSFPSQPGGFRLRYGRARNTGLAAVGVHPLTMTALNNFLAGGTQVRLELPGKGGIVMPVDSIEPPVVLLNDGSVTRISKENWPKIRSKIDKFLFLGDLLISFGDFLYNNKKLRPSGYTEEWWREELKIAIEKHFANNLENASKVTNISKQRLADFILDPMSHKPVAREAVAIAERMQIPLHPSYSFFWSNITVEALQTLRQWLLNSQIERENHDISRIVGKMDFSVKETLEKLCLPHKVVKNQLVVVGEEAFALVNCLKADSAARVDNTLSIFDALKHLSGITIRAKAPTTVGARMGRPEKAKRREMKPLVHFLFPVGLSGGSQRNLIVAAQKGKVHVDLIKRRCPNCKEMTNRIKCPACRNETVIEKICPRCGTKVDSEQCPACGVAPQSFERQELDLNHIISSVCRKLKVNRPKIVKGVKGLSNEHKVAEIVEKGILRAKENLSVYKDGTIRFDATNAPLTHFKPMEIKVSVEKLRQLGYSVDFQGKPLIDEEQICELKIQDVIIPKKSVTYFLHIARFIDDLLEKVYKVSTYYNARNSEDLVGHLVIGLAPHTSVGILGRILGFTDLNVCYAHPLWHSAKRRDCDGDEDALMLALDTLINFSKSYLPSQIGGIMDAPLFISPAVNPMEVQRQAHEFDVSAKYPLEFYEKTLEKVSPWKIANLFDLIAQRLGTKAQFEDFNYATPVTDINMGNRESIYKTLKKMTDKLNGQLELAEKIEAVDARRVALKVLTTHFLRDISGNLRAFSTQGFRCKHCNKRFRRIPLKGKCLECNSALSLTVYRGGIQKYLEASRHLIEKYKLPTYYTNRLELVRKEIITLFEGNRPLQISLEKFA